VPPREGQDVLHARHLTEEMHHHDRPGPGRDGRLDRARGDVEGGRIDIREDRRAARIVDGAGRGEKGERRRDDLIARIQVESPERQEQCVGPTRAADGMPGVRQLGHPALELGHLRPHDESLALHHGHHGPEHFILDVVVLSHQVEQRYVHRTSIPAPVVGPTHHVERARARRKPDMARARQEAEPSTAK
jgi:hypothetical protein